MSSQPTSDAQPAAAPVAEQPGKAGGAAEGKPLPPQVPLDTKVPVQSLMGAVEAIRKHHEQEVAEHKAAEAAALEEGQGGAAAAATATAAAEAGSADGAAAGGKAEGDASDPRPDGYPGAAVGRALACMLRGGCLKQDWTESMQLQC